MTRRVVVTGGAVISPLGEDWSSVEAALRSGKNRVRRMPEWDVYKGMNVRVAAPAIFTEPDYPRKKTRGMGKVALMAVASAERALASARLTADPVLGQGRCGAVYGSSTGSIDAQQDFFPLLVEHEARGINATTYIRFMPQTCVVNVGVFFGLKGRLLTANAACAASSSAIGLGYETIKHGQQDIMLCGGAEELSPITSAVFDTLYAASVKNEEPDKTPRPFDRDRDGLVIGEGAATLVLEELSHAQARGAPILAEIVGFGTNSDGDHITQPNRDTMQIAMRLALESAGISSEAIDYVNGHGTATSQGDIAESQATSGLFRRPVPFSAQKCYTGHCLGACGALEAWMTLHFMREGWFAPNINLDNLDPACGELGYILGEGARLDAEYCMSNNFAFGGINTSLIVRRWS